MKNSEFVVRFTEACGSSQPAQIAQLLNISYQAAKNYLDGRLPETKVLKTIAEKTPYSINWLLTGAGEKLAARPGAAADRPPAADQMRAFVREICLEVVGELLAPKVQPEPAQPKIVTLTSDRIKEEKILAASPVAAEKSDQ